MARSVVLAIVLSVSSFSVGSAQAHRAPRVHVEEPTVGPSMTPYVYRRVLLRAGAALQRCVALPRGRRPYVIRFELSLEPDGRLVLLGAQIPAHAARADSQDCLAQVIATLRAPAPDGGGTWRLGIPLLFHKRGVRAPPRSR